MKNSNSLFERSQAAIGAVLGMEQEGNIPDRLQIGGNNPPEPIVALEERLVINTDKWLAEYPVIEDEEVGKAAADYVEQLEKHLKAAQEAFKAEKAPHEEKLALVRARFHPRIDRIETCLKAIRPRFRAWIALKEQRRKAAVAAEELKAAEAMNRAHQLAELAAAGGVNAVSQTIIAREAAQEAEAARKAVAAMPQRAQVRGSLSGRTHSLRTVWHARIMDQDRCYQHFRDHAEVKTLLQRLANAAARGGLRDGAVGGCWIYDTQE